MLQETSNALVFRRRKVRGAGIGAGMRRDLAAVSSNPPAEPVLLRLGDGAPAVVVGGDKAQRVGMITSDPMMAQKLPADGRHRPHAAPEAAGVPHAAAARLPGQRS